MKKLPDEEIKKYHPLRLPEKMVNRFSIWRRYLAFSENKTYTYELLIEDIFKRKPNNSIIDFYDKRDEKKKWEDNQTALRKQHGLDIKEKPKVNYKCINLPIEMIERLREIRAELSKESGHKTTMEEMFSYYLEKFLSYHSSLKDYEKDNHYVHRKF